VDPSSGAAASPASDGVDALRLARGRGSGPAPTTPTPVSLPARKAMASGI
jgi:hypothetical protein